MHHDSRDYETAVDESAKAFERKLERQIEAGRDSAAALIQKVSDEVPEDTLVPRRALLVEPLEASRAIGVPPPPGLRFGAEGRWWGLHDNGRRQLLQLAGVPGPYAGKLLEEDWGRRLLAHSVQEHMAHGPDKRLLVRAVDRRTRTWWCC